MSCVSKILSEVKTFIKPFFLFLEVRFVLKSICPFLVSDVFSYCFFVKTYCAHTVATSPKCAPSDHSAAFCSKTHYLRSALALQKPNGEGNAVFGRYRNAQVNMIRHGVSFNNINTFDPRPLLDRLHYDPSLGAV